MLTLSARQSHSEKCLRAAQCANSWNVETLHRIATVSGKNYHCYHQQFSTLIMNAINFPANGKVCCCATSKSKKQKQRRRKNCTFVWRLTGFNSHTIYLFNCLLFFSCCCSLDLANGWDFFHSLSLFFFPRSCFALNFNRYAI